MILASGKKLCTFVDVDDSTPVQKLSVMDQLRVLLHQIWRRCARMIEYNKAFVDTAPFIYFIEKDRNNPQYYDRVKRFFSNSYAKDKSLVTSVITMEEYFVFSI